MDNRNTHRPASRPLHVTALAAAMLLAGCSSLDGVMGGARVDYRTEAAKTPELEVPPDLSQLARDGRYRPQAGVVTASGTAAAAGGAAAAPAASNASVALNSVGGMRIERQGNQRWLVVAQSPEQLWPQLQSFWQERGFVLSVDNPTIGVMETNWAENRGKLPQDFLRRTLGRLIDNLYDTGTRDSFRTRLERTAAGTEITISHRGVVEEILGPQRDRTAWKAAPTDPQLEAEFLTRLMVKLGGMTEPTARDAVAKAPDRAPTPPAKPGDVPRYEATSLEVNEPFERAYRRVGIALDRTGFTVEDRDRSAGLYFVRYVASSPDGQEPGFFAKLFSSKDAQAPVRYRVLVKAAGDGKSVVTVQTSSGQPETGDAAKRILGLVANDLR